MVMNYTLYLFIALGGALGALARFFLSTWIYEKTLSVFPWGTFVVNIMGCFIMGIVYVLGVEKLVINPNTRLFIAVGFLGSFTTFSALGLETMNIIKEGQLNIALLNGIGSLVTGVAAVGLGMITGQIISR